MLPIKNIVLFALALASPFCVHAQQNASKRYFDENDVEISEVAFYDKKETRQYLEVPGDSANTAKLIYREEEGRMDKVTVLYTIMAKAAQRELDTTKLMVIIYHPGKDPCNSSGRSGRKWYALLEKELDDIAQVQPLYVYKNNSGIKRKSFLPWIQDPEHLIETLFFKHHYPCGSFVVIAPDGRFYSYFGEFPKEYIWAAAKYLTS